MWWVVYWAKLADMNPPIRDISILPSFILKWPGFFYKPTLIYFEPKQVLTFVL